MLINNSNSNIINSNSFSLHDAILQNLNFNYFEKNLTIQLGVDGIPNSYLELNFSETIGFNITSCDFWGKSPHVLDFEYIEKNECELLSSLRETKTEFPYNPLCKLNEDEVFWECLFTFSSGDTLRVVCETLTILEQQPGNNQYDNQGTAD